ncbi:MAG: ribosome-associated translation inhibitor RaiA [bacterium]|nr:ribosome-associated translation inhibitor RaiA [bacterium]MDT8394911.1 ribosome-associated translation inhibitor RaiA [bacterium]
MQIEVSFKQMEQSEPLREYITDKLEKVLKTLSEPISAQSVLQVEKYRHIAKVTIHANGIIIKGKEETNDMYSSIDLVLDKLDRQVRKYKEKISRHGDREAVREYRASHSVIPEEVVDAGTAEVIKHKEIILKPMTVDEAIMQMELMNKSFLLFNNSRTGLLSVIYIRDDGHFGIIQPQAEG